MTVESYKVLDDETVPSVVVDRLPLYSRVLSKLALNGRDWVKSSELADILMVHAEQVRKDLSYLGHLGKRGLGYDVQFLSGELRRVLGTDKRWATVLVGVGSLGEAILSNGRLAAQGFPVLAAFDVKRARPEPSIWGVPVYPADRLTRFLHEHRVDVGIIAVPPDRAQPLADEVVHGGVRAILNYAPVPIHVPATVLVRSIDPIAELQEMTFYLNRQLLGEVVAEGLTKMPASAIAP